MISLPHGRRPVLLELDLTQPPVDPARDDPLARLRARGRPQLRAIVRALHEAGEDRHVAGLIGKVGGALPWAMMQELRLAVQAFASHGKPTVAWAEAFGEGTPDMAAYVLATAFDHVWLQPGGRIGMLGVSIETTFLRGALDRLGIEPELEQRHEYKNAVDILTRTEFTPAHRESLTRLTESVFTEAVEAIAAGRGMDAAHVRRLIDTGPRTASEAQAVGLVDELGYRDQIYDALRSQVAAGADLLFADRWRRRPKPSLPARHKGHVALVEVHGAIATGRSRPGPMGRAGSDSVAAQLRAAAKNNLARAVVMRINSPGGSAVGSEVIWREVGRVREAGKPVIVSMGEVAASGGYYIACPADVIIALPATLTGSIGVSGGKFVMNDLLERLGLTTGAIEQGARSLMFSVRRGFTEEERVRLASTIDATYADFVAKVAEGRRRTVAQIEAVARGRVWTGRDAVSAGLVDELGGLRQAIEVARTRAGLPDDAPVLPPVRVPAIARLMRPKNSEDPRVGTQTGPPWPQLSDLTAVLDLPEEVALRMPKIRIR